MPNSYLTYIAIKTNLNKNGSFNLKFNMNKIAKRRFTKNRRLIATASVAMCMLCGAGGFNAQAAPMPQVVAASKATKTLSLV